MTVQIVILSAVRLYRDCLESILSRASFTMEIVGVCASADDALEVLRRHPKAVVLVDVHSLDRLSEVRRLAGEAPHAVLLGLALSPDSDHEVVAAAEAGIAGYIPPEASVEDLLARIEHVIRGEILCAPRVAGTLARRLASLSTKRSVPGAVDLLTAREREVLELLAAGQSNKQIARQLAIGVATVKNHVHSILGKLNVKRRGEAVAAVQGDQDRARLRLVSPARRQNLRTPGRIPTFPAPGRPPQPAREH